MRTSRNILLMSLLLGTSLVSVGCSSGGGSNNDTKTPIDNQEPSTQSQARAFVSGSVATENSTFTASSYRTSSASSVDEDTVAKLVIDTNNNAKFGDDGDTVLSASVSDSGAFDFGAVNVLKDKQTNAQITVSKKGYAPYRKVITLSNGQSVSISADAASTPLSVEAVKLSDLRASGAMDSSFLKLGTRQSGTTVSSYAQIMSFSQMLAQADVPLSEDVKSESIIPLSAIPEDVEVINAQMQTFDPTDPDDAENFPGEYIGVGEGGSEAEQRLVSVGFDYMSLTDQNGNPIELDATALSKASKLLPQAVDFTSCLRTSTRHLGEKQLELFKKYGDDDNTTDEFEIPLWFYNSEAGNWRYLGQAEVYEDSDAKINYSVDSTVTHAYAKMCITQNWGTSVNLDYSFEPEQPSTVCVQAKDQSDNPISNMRVSVNKDTAYESHYLNSEGKAAFKLTAGSNVSTYKFSYSGALTGWNSVDVQSANVVSGGAEGCDNTISIEVVNPYSATLKVTAKEIDGTIATNAYVSVYNQNWNDYYYESQMSDENGVATFKVKPNVTYEASFGAAKASANINGTKVDPENADDGRFATLTLQEQEVAPEVHTYMRNSAISEDAQSVNFSVYARDANGDAISLSALTLNGTALSEGSDYTLNYNYSDKGYAYFGATLDLSNATLSAITPTSLTKGDYSLQATYSDGKSNGVGSASFSVNENRAPRISSVYLTDNGSYSYINDKIEAGVYGIYVYAYDPDGDVISYTYTLDDNNLTSLDSVNLSDGAHTLVIKAQDTGDKSSTREFDFFVGNNAPEITSFGSSTYSVDSISNEKFRLYAFAQDKDNDDLTLQATSSTGGTIALTPSYNGSRYFRSELINISENTTFSLVANDGDKNSTVKTLEVVTYEANQKPVFTQELSSNLVTLGTQKELTCSATDPEGDTLTYEWRVDTEVQSSTSTTLTYTFDTAKAYVISCSATDQNTNEPGVAVSNATITVYDPNASGNLVINTLAGAIVSLHDTTTLAPTTKKIADATGNALFAISGTDRVTFSISVGPDVAMDEAKLFKDALAQTIYSAYQTCLHSMSAPSECTSMDKESLLAGSTIPNWTINISSPMDANTTLTDSIDLDKSGDISQSEFIAHTLTQYDANQDGKVSYSEWGMPSSSGTKAMGYPSMNAIRSEFFVNMPVRTYNIEFEQYEDGPYHEEGSFDVDVSFSGFNEGSSINADGSGYLWTSTNSNGESNTSLNVYHPQSDGLYSFLYSYNDNGQRKYLFDKDNTKAELTSLSYAASDFNLVADKNVTLNKDVENGWFHLNIYYNGLHISPYFNSVSIDNNRSVSTFLEHSDFTYAIDSYGSFRDEVTGFFYSYDSWGYYTTNTLENEYTMSDYPNLSVSASVDDTKTVHLSGSDFAKVNFAEFEYEGYDRNNSINVSVSFNYLVVPSSFADINVSAVLPEGLSAATLNVQDLSKWIYLEEIKGYNQAQLLDLFGNYAGEELGVRYLEIGLENGASSMYESSSRSKAPSKRVQPFSINYNVNKAFAR